MEKLTHQLDLIYTGAFTGKTVCVMIPLEVLLPCGYAYSIITDPNQ